MALEEIEHHLQDVQCEDGILRMGFVDKSSARDAFHSCHGENGGLVVTSHESCNDDGQRAVYRIHDVSFANDGEALELSVTEVSWQNAFDHLVISFGHTLDDHLFRKHSDFAKIRKKRQAIDIPTNTSDSVNTVIFNLSSQLIDKTFVADSFLVGLVQFAGIPTIPIEMGCKNCTTKGQVALTQGAIKIDTTQIDIIPDFLEGGDDGKEITNVITGGFMELAATGVGAHLEIFAKPKASGAFEIALFPVPILGFVVPGIGQAGAVFEPRIAVDFEISGGFELNYGIDVAIPDQSTIRLDLTNIGNSAVTGFQASTLTPLPFNASATDIDAILGLAFKPTIPIGFEFTDKLKAEVSVSMNLPRLSAKLSTNVVANCGNGTNSTHITSSTAPYANTTSRSLPTLGPLVLVEANVSVTVDVAIGLTLPLLPPPLNEVTNDANIFTANLPLVTSCINPQDAFKPVTPAVADQSCNTTTTTTIHHTSTATHTSTAHVRLSKSTTSTATIAVKEPTMPSETLIPFPLNATLLSSAVSSVSNVTFALISPTPTPALSVTTIVESSGFLQPSNSSIAPAQQTGVAQFTGAAVRGSEVPSLRWRLMGWQVDVLGISVAIGAMIL
ncbi:hypothetical protein EK21DRAFT_64355 [Setomelanomma holmii]|uniref:Uncharacterized protein n=1 Tax=Setomelanomma holmii TaxID=210430 RepID=A0A9P4HCU7_9PLEO|nr:hypothetical protein EK21DRAFT_64355 [Setomelanomma holmii]